MNCTIELLIIVLISIVNYLEIKFSRLSYGDLGVQTLLKHRNFSGLKLQTMVLYASLWII